MWNIKPCSTTVVYPDQNQDALKVILKVAKEQKNKIIIPELSSIDVISSNISGTKFLYEGIVIDLPLVGDYQIKNVSVVLKF